MVVLTYKTSLLSCLLTLESNAQRKDYSRLSKQQLQKEDSSCVSLHSLQYFWQYEYGKKNQRKLTGCSSIDRSPIFRRTLD